MVNSVSTKNTFQQIPRFDAQSRASRPSPNLASRRDSTSISLEATRTTQLMDKYNSLTSINGQQVQQLRAVNNKLTILWNLPYRFTSGSGMLSYLLFHSNGTNWRQLFAEVYREIGAEGDFFANDIFHQDGNSFAILSKLAGGAGSSINCMYCRSEIIATLTAAGIEPGWVEMSNGNETHRFYFTRCGYIESEAISNSDRELMNTWDFRDFGFQVGDKIMVNFEYYTIGADGRIYVPEGVPVIRGATFWFPGQEGYYGWERDENGEWHREFPSRFVSILSDEFWDNVVANRHRYFPCSFISPSASERYGSNFATAQAAIIGYAATLSAAVPTANAHPQGANRETTIQRMNDTMSQSTLHTLGMHLNLVRETARSAQQVDNNNGLENALRSMANAFEAAHADITSNSDTPSHVDYLKDALFMTANYVFFRNMKIDDNSDFTQALKNAENRANIFVTAFLDHFREHGAAESFDFAWAALNTNQ